MDNLELQKLRELPIEGVAERLGLQVTRHKALCPFHDDHHASLSFSVSRNTFRCFVCNAKGGTIDLVMRYLNKDFLEACRWLGDGALTPPPYGHPLSEGETCRTLPIGQLSTLNYQLSTDSKPSTLNAKLSFDPSRYARFFEHPWLSEPARRFLFDERRLDPRIIRWCRLTSWKDKQGTDWLQIPYYNQEGQLVGVQNRNLNYQRTRDKGRKTEDNQPQVLSPTSPVLCPKSSVLSPTSPVPSPDPPRFRFATGSQCGIYNLPVLNRLQPGEALFITEGPSDCWAMLSAGHKAIAIPSATLLSPKDKQQLSTLNTQLSTEFHMYPDQDAPGEQLFLQLKAVLPNLVHHHLPPGCKDFSDYYLSFGLGTKDGGQKTEDGRPPVLSPKSYVKKLSTLN